MFQLTNKSVLMFLRFVQTCTFFQPVAVTMSLALCAALRWLPLLSHHQQKQLLLSHVAVSDGNMSTWRNRKPNLTATSVPQANCKEQNGSPPLQPPPTTPNIPSSSAHHGDNDPATASCDGDVVCNGAVGPRILETARSVG